MTLQQMYFLPVYTVHAYTAMCDAMTVGKENRSTGITAYMLPPSWQLDFS